VSQFKFSSAGSETPSCDVHGVIPLQSSDCPPNPIADIQRLNGPHQSSNFRFDNGSFKDKRPRRVNRGVVRV
jgi:hypothetical protein